jgi:hypothetical protein
MIRLALIVLVFVAGCGTKLVDPCAHQSGACLALQIDSSAAVTHLSSAQVHVAGDAIDVLQSVTLQNGAPSTDLPVALAITFPGLTDIIPVQIDVVGLLNGNAVGQATLSANIAPGQHSTMHVQLSPVVDNGNDGGNDVDMASSDLAGYVSLTVDLAGTGNGSVSASGLVCAGATCTGLYAPHTMVTLGATAAPNATFTGWSGGGCVGASTCTVAIDVATTVTATFDWKFVPSHVSASAYKTDAANLSGVTNIDTHNLTINGSAPAAGITFAFQSGVAVLSVGTWNISSPIAVTGDAPLVVVAAGGVTVTGATISADGQGAVPGPGGNAICSAAGTGVPASGVTGSGGGGEFGGGASAGQLPKGSIYGSNVTDFCGGAAGGNGTRKNNLDNTCAAAGPGGGGGGAIQISSAVSIVIHSGRISAGGGGGGASCAHQNAAPSFGSSNAAPGGGGSGGLIFLEAPTITLGNTGTANLFANGAGGGGTAGLDTTSTSNPGVDALRAQSTAPGGTGSVGNGGEGAASLDGTTLTNGTAPTGTDPDFGGGGGGVGRIWLRTRGAAAATNTTLFSPAPTIDKTL